MKSKVSKYMPLYMLENIRDNFYRAEYRKDGTCKTYDAQEVDAAIKGHEKKIVVNKSVSIIEDIGL